MPYTDDDIASAAESLKGKSEMDALVAYLQVLGNDKVQLLAAYVYSLSHGLNTERLQAEGKSE